MILVARWAAACLLLAAGTGCAGKRIAAIDPATGMEFVKVRGGTFLMGEIRGKAWLGVQLREIFENERFPAGERFGMAGAEVVDVVAEGPAQRAGILTGDILVELNGRPFRFGDSLVALIRREEPGATVELAILRGGRPLKVAVILGENDGLREGKERDDERPLHKVTLDDFLLGRFEVTQGEWERIMGTNPSRRKGTRLPVDGVRWEEAQDFAHRLGEKSGRRYRLPTEAEWEYAARAGGRKERWPGTSAEKKIGKHAWFAANSGGETHPVGGMKPNALGLHDMAGNVAEWCADWYQRTYYSPAPARNPTGPPTGEVNLWYEKNRHVVRGGSFRSEAWECRSSARAVQTVEGSSDDTGFRLVMEAH